MERISFSDKPYEGSLVKYSPTELVTTKNITFLPRTGPNLAFGSVVSQDDPSHWAITDTCLNILSQLETEDVLNAIISPREWEEGGKKWRQRVSTVPATRSDVEGLLKTLDNWMQERQGKETGICPVRRELYTQCLDEIIRQVTIICAERGILLHKIRNEIRITVAEYESLFISATAYAVRKTLTNEIMRQELESQIEALYQEQTELNSVEQLLKQELTDIIEEYEMEMKTETELWTTELDELKKVNIQLKKQMEVSMGMGKKRPPRPVEN